MFEAFKNIFSKSGGEMPSTEIVVRSKGEPAPDSSDPLADVAVRPNATREFVFLLREHGVHVVGKNARKKENKPHYDFVGAPGEFYVFSSQQRAREFIRTIPIKESTPYSLLGLSSDFLLTNDFSRTRLVLNPRSRYERVITNEDIEELRRIHTA